MSTDTIYALATGKGRAGVAVIRLSGPQAGTAAKLISKAPLPKARLAARSNIYHPKTNDLLDDCLILWFPSPGSYTGEDVIELHVHGGLAVINAVMEALGIIKGLRLAGPGEFTRRAFLNDKMDLTEAEGLIDLIDAETDAQRKQAQRQSQGALGKLYVGWMDRLVPLLAYYEAEIDFADEELPDQLGQRNEIKIDEIRQELLLHLDDHNRGERLRDGVRIAIIGPPNAGKSSLLNALAKRDVAIVSDIAGTTRDVIEVHLDLNGYPVILSDTAGIRDAKDAIEDEGIKRALKAAEDSDLKVVVVDASSADWKDQLANHQTADSISLVNKIDSFDIKLNDQGFFPVSVKSGEGIQSFLDYLGEKVSQEFGLSETPSITRNRHREAVIEAVEALERCLIAPEVALAAEDLRIAVRALGRITGQVDVEDLLDIIFREFCIGK